MRKRRDSQGLNYTQLHANGLCMKRLFLLLPIALLLAGCTTTSQNAEFTKTITFSSLQSFSFKHTLVSGMDFRRSEEMYLKEISSSTVSKILRDRGFDEVEEEGDFFAVVKWRKARDLTPAVGDSIDGPRYYQDRAYERAYLHTPRLHLIVEIYETSTRNLFWRKDLPNILDALQFTEERIVASLERAMENFPERVEKDPNLPDIE